MNVRRWSLATGLLFLLTGIAGGLGEAYIPMKLIVHGNPAATLANIRAHEFLFRLGFATYLIEAMCDIAIALALYVLLRRVNKEIALLAAFFGLVSTAVYAVAEFVYLAVLLVRNDPATASLLLRTFSLWSTASMAFYGVATLIRGILIFRSRYLPKFLGALMAIAGVCFIVQTYIAVLAPRYASDVLLLPMFLTLLAMTAWFLTKGVDAAKWDAAAGLQ
ncbi:MAG TPA: DUF4386 domain-containing protein [Thermoanaerobaculia bacterium]|nr:DUF4386 domain-containing protein [Thermoanaerobaculia bacterium]